MPGFPDFCRQVQRCKQNPPLDVYDILPHEQEAIAFLPSLFEKSPD